MTSLSVVLAAESGTSTAPWWAAPVAGVIGALIALAGASLTKQLELARSDQSRWDEEILDLSIELIGKFRTFVDGLPPSTGDIMADARVRAEPFAALASDIQPTVQRLSLIASGQFYTALAKLAGTAMIAPEVKYPAEATEDQIRILRKYVPDFDQTIKDFERAVRKEIRAKK